MIKVLDLFAGAGGLSTGLIRAGFYIDTAIEVNPVFVETYKANHPNVNVINKDICLVDFTSYAGKIDLICGGPPCQGFSTVGKKNKNDIRNTLFLQFLRAVKEIEPKYVLFENVSGFKKMYNGEAFSTLIEKFNLLGYQIDYNIVNSVEYGIPQYRERFVLIACKRNKKIKFPTRTTFQKPSISLKDAIYDLNGDEQTYSSLPLNQYQEELRKNSSYPQYHTFPKHGKSLLEKIQYVPYGGGVEDIPVHLRPKSFFKNTYSRLTWEKPAYTITRNFGTPSSGRCIHPNQDRGLTTQEGARIQSFPDDYIFYGSLSEKNLQIGNAVPPRLAFEIGKDMLNLIA